MTDLMRVLKLGGGDTFTDRLSSRFTFGILIIIALIATTKLYFGESIACWTPAQFTQSHNHYSNQACLSSATYYLPNNQPLFGEDAEASEVLPQKYVSYHHWIPLLLIFQALLFYLPRRFWKRMGSKCGLSVSGVVDACLQTEKSSLEDVVESVDRFLSEASEGCLANAYLVFVYLVTKFMYLANLILQIFLMNFFLKKVTYMYGLENLIKLFTKTSWKMSKRFPRDVICPFTIRHQGIAHRYSVQCGMPINTFYEVAVTFLWLWLVYVVVCSIFSFFSWLLTSFIPSYQVRWVRRRVGGGEGVDDFVRKRLGLDGCFILHMVSSNCNDVVASQLLSRLWQRYTQQLQEEQQPTLKEAIYPTLN